MKVAYVSASLEDEAAGTSYVIPAMAKACSAAGVDIKLFSVARETGLHRDKFEHATFNADLQSWPVISKLTTSSAMKAALLAEEFAVIHSHGLWQMPFIYSAHVKEKRKCKLVVSAHGMLSPDALKFSRVRKGLFNMLWQNHALGLVDMFHATSEGECADIRRAGFKQPVVIVPPGVESASVNKPRVQHQRTILYMGRIHPIKRLDDLLDVWRDVSGQHKDWLLRIIGPDDNAEAERIKLRVASEKLQRVSLEPAAFGAAKAAAYFNADLFVLPSQSENFAMTVAEALAHGVPVICSKGAPWSRLETEGCGWWTDIGVAPLGAALSAALQQSPQQLQEMGERGRQWMERDFSWNAAGSKMAAAYHWLHTGGEKPPHIHLYEDKT